MNGWNEKLHPRGHGGRFARKWSRLTPSARKVRKIGDSLREGGFTYDPHNSTFPHSGSSVAFYPEREARISMADLSGDPAGAVRDYIEANADILENDPDAAVGGWVDDGYAYLDIVRVIDDSDRAKMQAAWKAQLAIFNLDTFEEIEIMDMKERERRDRIASIQGLQAAEDVPADGSVRPGGNRQGSPGDGGRAGGREGEGVAPPEDPRTFMDAELFKTEQEIRDKGLALDIPYEAGSADPKKIIYADTDDEEHKVPEGILKDWSLNPDLPEIGEKDKADDEA